MVTQRKTISEAFFGHGLTRIAMVFVWSVFAIVGLAMKG